MTSWSRSRPASPARRATASRSRRTSCGRARPRSRCSAARSSRSRSPRRPGSACGSSSTGGRASRTPGSLDADVVASVLADARDNASYGAADRGLRARDAGRRRRRRAARRSTSGATTCSARPPRRRSSSRSRPTARCSASDARVRGRGVDRLRRRRARDGDGRVDRRPGRDPADDELGVERGAGGRAGRDPDRIRLRRRRASFGELDIDRVAAMAAERSTRLLGATQPATRRIPVVFDPMVTASVLALIGSALSGEAVLKGRSMFADRLGETIAAPAVTIVDDPTNPEAFGATPVDGEGVPTRRGAAGARRHAARLPPQPLHGPPDRVGDHRVRGPRLRVDARRRRPRPAPRAGGEEPRPRCWPRCPRRSTCSRSRGCTRGRTR